MVTRLSLEKQDVTYRISVKAEKVHKGVLRFRTDRTTEDLLKDIVSVQFKDVLLTATQWSVCVALVNEKIWNDGFEGLIYIPIPSFFLFESDFEITVTFSSPHTLTHYPSVDYYFLPISTLQDTTANPLQIRKPFLFKCSPPVQL